MTTDPATRASWHNPYDFAGLPARIDAAGELFRRAGVDAAVVCGDVTHRGDEESWRTALTRLSAGLGSPVFVVAGNHDLIEDDDRLGRLLPPGCRLLPAEPVKDGRVRLAGVPIKRGVENRTPRWTGDGDLTSDGHVTVVASHYPVISRAERLRAVGLAYPRDLGNRADLCEHVADRGPVLVLSGHIHARESHAHSSVLQLCAGALIEAPHEAAIVDVRVGRRLVLVRRRARPLGPPPAGADPVLAPASEMWVFAAGRWRALRSRRRR